jgi:hypothetical protein
MSLEKARWNLGPGDIEHLSAELRPIRSSREVGEMLGISTSLVCQIERNALRKIVRSLRKLERPGRCRTRESHS